jgi:hypothetical protein
MLKTINDLNDDGGAIYQRAAKTYGSSSALEEAANNVFNEEFGLAEFAWEDNAEERSIRFNVPEDGPQDPFFYHCLFRAASSVLFDIMANAERNLTIEVGQDL